MNKNAKDLTGKRFGRLTVVEYYGGNNRKRTCWKCVCDCGKEKIVSSDLLTSGKTSSCGCLYFVSNAGRRKTHGMTNTRIYNCWTGMKERCRRNKRYSPVKVSRLWKNDFSAFYKWSKENGYDDTLTLDRIDPKGDYEPDNCRWVSYKVQENNRTNNRKLTINGETHTIAEWSDITGIGPATLLWRANAKWPEEDMLMKPNLNNANIRRGKR